MTEEQLNVSPGERRIVRELAHRVAEAAGAPRMPAIFKRWHDVNALRRPDRAPVWCRPVGAWREILPESSLRCQGRLARDIERQFRQTLFKVELGDDTPVSAGFDVPVVFDVAPANIWGVDVARRSTGRPGGAWAVDPPLKSEADFDRLAMPRWTPNLAATNRALNAVGDLFDDILPVRAVCRPAFDNATLGHLAADLRGLENMLMDMIDRPRLMHRLMAYLRDVRLAWLDALESSGQLAPNTAEPMICSEPIGSTGGPITLAHCWCAGNSQEFDPVSPAMWREFCLEYQRPIFARFGLACYGCCENLAGKIAGVLTIPNLRIFVCSAWTTLDVALANVPESYCIMWRQKATDVVMPDDTEPIRAELLSGASKLRGRPYQIVLRELETLAGHPDRLADWTRLAIEAAERCA